jgi:putative heme utilization carrier protein HutX
MNAATIPASTLQQRLAAEPGAILESVAKEFGATLRDAAAALPVPMRRFTAGENFVPVLQEVARWGEVTVILHTDDGVMEFTGPVPEGKIAQGYYNLAGRTGFHGHLRHDRCAAIGFVERPLFGRLSASVLFFNCDGGIMFKIFVGRDERRELLADQLAAFRSLAERLCAAEVTT